MRADVDQLWATVAADFNALVSKIERMIELLAEDEGSGAEIERLQHVRSMAKRGASIARNMRLSK